MTYFDPSGPIIFGKSGRAAEFNHFIPLQVSQGLKGKLAAWCTRSTGLTMQKIWVYLLIGVEAYFAWRGHIGMNLSLIYFPLTSMHWAVTLAHLVSVFLRRDKAEDPGYFLQHWATFIGMNWTRLQRWIQMTFNWSTGRGRASFVTERGL